MAKQPDIEEFESRRFEQTRGIDGQVTTIVDTWLVDSAFIYTRAPTLGDAYPRSEAGGIIRGDVWCTNVVIYPRISTNRGRVVATYSSAGVKNLERNNESVEESLTAMIKEVRTPKDLAGTTEDVTQYASDSIRYRRLTWHDSLRKPMEHLDLRLHTNNAVAHLGGRSFPAGTLLLMSIKTGRVGDKRWRTEYTFLYDPEKHLHVDKDGIDREKYDRVSMASILTTT